MQAQHIAIVGGGPGGLITAYLLEKMASVPIRITLFEAGPRLGGKILTPQFKVAPVRYEAGAAEFYDYSVFEDDPLKDLIAELGLSICPMGGPAVVMNGRFVSNLDDLRVVFGERVFAAAREFDRLARDRMTPQEFYHADDPEGCVPLRGDDLEAVLAPIPEPVARDYIRTLIHSDLATEPEQTSAEYGLQNYLMNDPAYMQLYGIVGGNEQLPRELAARITADVRLNCPAAEIERSGSRLRVRSRPGGRDQTDDFDYVIVALPHSHLNSLVYRDPVLSEAMRRHHARFNYPAHYLRITMLFDRPFWRDACSDSYWMLDRLGGCCLYDESSRDPSCPYGILGWLIGGDAAREMSDLGDEQLVEQALAALPHFHAKSRPPLLEARVHRWVGAVSALPGGRTPLAHDRKHQPEPGAHPNLFVVGDYLFDSTINGVVDSAHYVASWIAANLADHVPSAPASVRRKPGEEPCEVAN